MIINVTLQNNIRIENPPADVAHRLIEKYTVANPDFYKLERLGKWTGNTPETLAMWQRDGDTLILPYGAMFDVLHELGAHGCTISSETSHGDMPHDFRSHISLYPYQENAVQAITRAHRGILVAPCGSGKTQMGLEVAARMGVKTLWLTHTHDLLNQSLERAKQNFDLPPKAFGTITAGKVEIGEVITFATVQTMAKLDLTQYRDVWGCLIVDECHHVAGTPTRLMQFGKVVGSLNAAYKFGLTATPKRSDGLITCMYAYLGPKVYEVDKSEVVDKTCPVKYIQIDTGWDCDPETVTNSDGTLNYTGLISSVCGDAERNNQIARVISDVVNLPNSRILVLSERVQHAYELIRALENIRFEQAPISTEIVTGQTRKSIRENAFKRLKSGECKIIFATYQLAKEGLDVPELTHLIMASPNKTEVVVTQSVGRVARKSPGKRFGIVVDFVDKFPPLLSWAKKRERIYKKLGYEPH